MMTRLHITHQRLRNERLAGPRFKKPEDAVAWLCAVQSQDYGGAKWAIAQRTTGATSAQMDRLFDQGKILRTHVMRPTWHFVMPADIRWLLELTAPRVKAGNAYYDRKLELDDALFRRSNDALRKGLRGGADLTRSELSRLLEDARIKASGLRLAYIVMRAELDGVICSGPLRGKQFTYALLDERVGKSRRLDRAESLAELARRYFTSHGPALVRDFTWWSRLTATDANAGIAMARLNQETVDGKRYWFAASTSAAAVRKPTIHLLPNYDEYLIAYKDHSASFDPSLSKLPNSGVDALQAHIVVRNGHVIGGWRRMMHGGAITISTNLWVRLDRAEQAALDHAAEDYGRFMEMPVTVAAAI